MIAVHAAHNMDTSRFNTINTNGLSTRSPIMCVCMYRTQRLDAQHIQEPYGALKMQYMAMGNPGNMVIKTLYTQIVCMHIYSMYVYAGIYVRCASEEDVTPGSV